MASNSQNGHIPQKDSELNNDVKTETETARELNKNGGIFISVDLSDVGGKTDSTITLQDFQDGVADSTDGLTVSNDLGFAAENGVSKSSDFLGVPRTGHRMSIMEEESAKERLRISLLKQCSAILKQNDQRYSKETLHKAFQDEVLMLILLFI